MLLEPGFADGATIVHLTHTTLVAEALCGEKVVWHGEPDGALICPDCDELARFAETDHAAWLAEAQVAPTLGLAA